MFKIEREYYYLLKKIRDKIPFSIAHFNDGEMDYIINNRKRPISYGDQDYSKLLRDELEKAFLTNNKLYYRGLPCKLCHAQLYTSGKSLLNNNHTIYTEISACVFHHNYHNKLKFLKLLQNYNIVWIANKDFNLKKLCNIINIDIKKSRLIYVPKKNAFDSLNILKNEKFEPTELVILLCGPLGRILSCLYFEKFQKTTFLCLGSYFDNLVYNKIHKYYCLNGVNHRYCKECFPFNPNS